MAGGYYHQDSENSCGARTTPFFTKKWEEHAFLTYRVGEFGCVFGAEGE